MSIFIVAEIGINHNGDINIAKKLIDSVAEFGFDAVKFQKREISKVYSKNFLNEPRKSPWGNTTSGTRSPAARAHRTERFGVDQVKA